MDCVTLICCSKLMSTSSSHTTDAQQKREKERGNRCPSSRRTAAVAPTLPTATGSALTILRKLAYAYNLCDSVNVDIPFLP